jgi:hypothetical protein
MTRCRRQRRRSLRLSQTRAYLKKGQKLLLPSKMSKLPKACRCSPVLPVQTCPDRQASRRQIDLRAQRLLRALPPIAQTAILISGTTSSRTAMTRFVPPANLQAIRHPSLPAEQAQLLSLHLHAMQQRSPSLSLSLCLHLYPIATDWHQRAFPGHRPNPEQPVCRQAFRKRQAKPIPPLNLPPHRSQRQECRMTISRTSSSRSMPPGRI